MTVPGLMTTVPAPSVSMPPPASPEWLLLIVLLFTVSVQLLLTVFAITTPPPSAFDTLLVMTILVSVRLVLPWSRMPPPVEVRPSGLPWSKASPLVMVKTCMVTRNLVVGGAARDDDEIERAVDIDDRRGEPVLQGLDTEPCRLPNAVASWMG